MTLIQPVIWDERRRARKGLKGSNQFVKICFTNAVDPLREEGKIIVPQCLSNMSQENRGRGSEMAFVVTRVPVLSSATTSLRKNSCKLCGALLACDGHRGRPDFCRQTQREWKKVAEKPVSKLREKSGGGLSFFFFFIKVTSGLC